MRESCERVRRKNDGDEETSRGRDQDESKDLRKFELRRIVLGEKKERKKRM